MVVHREVGGRAVTVLAKHVTEVQGRLGRAVGEDRRDEVSLIGQAGLVGMAEEGDQAVIAHEHDVLQRVERPVRVDDALDLQPHQVLGEGARRVGIGLEVGGHHLIILADVDDHPRRLGCQRGQVRRHRAQVARAPAAEPARAVRIPDDDGAVRACCSMDQVRRRPRCQGGDGTQRGTPTGEQRHGQVEGLGQAEDAVAAADADVDVGGVVPRVPDDAFAGRTVVGRDPDQAPRLCRGIGGGNRGNAGQRARGHRILRRGGRRVRIGTVGVRGIRVR